MKKTVNKGVLTILFFALSAGLFSAAAGPGIGITGTYVLAGGQYPAAIKKWNASAVYVIYSGPPIRPAWRTAFFRSDTILNLKGLTDSAGKCIRAYRLIFKTVEKIDSVWQVDDRFKLTDKGYNRGNQVLELLAYDEHGKLADQFLFNYGKKYREAGREAPPLAVLLRQAEVYNQSDRNLYAAGAAWVLSIGINRYEGDMIGPLENCESDARSYNAFFRDQYTRLTGMGSYYHEYVLLGKQATKPAIIEALKDIAGKAAPNDYFIFNFSGFSYPVLFDSVTKSTYFFPYDTLGFFKRMLNKEEASREKLNQQLVSLKALQEHIQLIPASNQLFISEAGNSDKFRVEFIRTLMQNSPTVTSILNKNRVIIVPNGYGLDVTYCRDSLIRKGPINYYITSPDSSLNIYDLFRTGPAAAGIVYKLKNREMACQSARVAYFDIFFEQEFLRQYKDIFGDEEAVTRGLKVKPHELAKEVSGLEGKHYALIIGTDHYRGRGWNTLSNPVGDARAVAAELKDSYGFEVQLLEDKPMDSIYAALRNYYRIAKPGDQFVLYVAGHGDMDDELLDDGFIVCTDSKPVEEDPVRNSYISYTKLQKMLNNIPARQVLVLLDVCYGGVFDPNAFNKAKREGTAGTISNRNVLQFLKDKLPLRTRKFLSSVGTEPAFDGKASKHSPFANLLLQVLRARGDGSNGLVTLSDIFRVLQTASLNETATLRITPAMADFGNVDAFSEFIFIPAGQ
ncbi:MAG: caspase family protein [Sphingobacteriales bacterium]|nr:caspase family protein [Sphingobacteriales bacterium]